MRRRFSERYGFVEPKDTFQIESMNQELKNRLWNTIKIVYIDNYIKYGTRSYPPRMTSEYYHEVQYLYSDFFKSSDEPYSRKRDFIEDFKLRFFELEWMKTYDLLEYLHNSIGNTEGCISNLDFEYCMTFKEEFIKVINKVLEEEMSAYRFIDDYIVPIINEVEIKEIEEALQSEYSAIEMHLSKGLELLSDKVNPDYQNSIKESISAVESLAKTITGSNKDLGACLKAMDLDIQKQFIKTLSGLYSWTSQADGMRHAHTGEELKTSFDEAKFMLVTCSAFVNYMIAKKGTK